MKSSQMQWGILLLALMLLFGLAGCDTGVISSSTTTGSQGIQYTVTADGAAESITTQEITLVFAEEITLTLADIEIIDKTGTATPVAVNPPAGYSAPCKVWILEIDDVEGGNILVRVNQAGVSDAERPITIHQEIYDFTVVPDSPATKLLIDILDPNNTYAGTDLEYWEITVISGSGNGESGVAKKTGALTGSGIGQYELELYVEQSGDILVYIEKSGITKEKKVVSVVAP